jgi:hypothetical protein
MKIEKAWVKWGNLWERSPTASSTATSRRSTRTQDQRTDPVTNWAYYSDTEFEVWPLPATNGVANGINESPSRASARPTAHRTTTAASTWTTSCVAHVRGRDVAADGKKVAAQVKADAAMARLQRARQPRQQEALDHRSRISRRRSRAARVIRRTSGNRADGAAPFGPASNRRRRTPIGGHAFKKPNHPTFSNESNAPFGRPGRRERLMAYVLVDNFAGGVDRSRPRYVGPPGTLWSGINGHLTRGGDFEKRKAFVQPRRCRPGNYGLAKTSAGLYVFGSAAAPAPCRRA